MQVDVKTFLCLKMNDFNKSNTLKKSRKNDKNSRFFQKLKKKILKTQIFRQIHYPLVAGKTSKKQA